MALKPRIFWLSRVLNSHSSRGTCVLKENASRIIASRPFHSGRPLLAGSPLLNLSGLSTSREAQHFSKEYRIPRTEFSPHLELIRSSEVLPYVLKPSTPDGDAKDQAHTSRGTSHRQERLGGSQDHGRGSMSASAKTVTATMKHLIDELAVTRSTLQTVSLEKARLDSEVSRKNREVLALSLLSTAFVLALLFPDERAALSRWALGSKENSWAATTKSPSKKRYLVEQEQEDQKWSGLNTLEPDSIPAAARRFPLASSQGPTRVHRSSATKEENHGQAGSSPLSGYFWSSASSR